MNPETRVIWQQVNPAQRIDFQIPVSNVLSMTWTMLNFSGITTTGKSFWVACPEAARTNVRGSAIFGTLLNYVWREQSPIPTNRSNQMIPFPVKIYSMNNEDLTCISSYLQSDGTITYAPGWSIEWEITFCHLGPDTLIKMS